MTVSLLLKKAYNDLSAAMKAEVEGLYEKAVEKYLSSAENLLLAAKRSSGSLKIVRLENAEFLINKVDEIKRKMFKDKLRASSIGKEGLKMLEELGLSEINVPRVTMDDVAGLDNVKEEIKVKVIYPFKYPKEAEKYGISFGGGILLFGPPGTGKTHIARAIANEVEALFILINPSSLVNQWFGVFERNISKVFKAARLCSPSIIFIDEIDAMIPKRRSSSSSVMKRAVPTILAEMDGLSRNKEAPILIIGATNNPWDLDEAVLRPGRFDEKIYVPPPDFEARRKIFELNLRGKRCSPNIDFELLAEKTESYSGADIQYICRKAAEKVFRDAVEKGIDRLINTQDLIDVIREVPPSIPKDLLKKYEEFKNKSQYL